MRDFSIDSASEKIYSAKTKEYFEEVIKSYYNESYRSAIVMLHSIIIVDLLFKLEDLKEIYEDEKAIQILKEITELQEKNPTSPDWEKKLIEFVHKRTNLFEPQDYLHFVAIQQHRHLCAHPILSREYNLYTPNKETTRAHIRNALEGILTKPPILSKDIVSDFLENLSRIKDIIITDEDLKRHINSRYLSKINLTVENQLFRSLWKLTFRSDDVKCTENRIYNLKVLNIIVDNNYREYQKVISNESDYYSDINTKYLRELFSLFNQFPKLYEFLNDSAKVLIENFIKKDSDFEALAWFITGDIGTHMEMILEHRKEPLETYTNYRICAKSILQINNDSIASVQKEERHRFIIKMFGYSYDFDNADELYDMVINPYLKDFSKKSLKLLVSKANGNSQIYGRKAAPRTLNEIRMEVDKRYNSGFNYEPYTNFWRAMEY